MSTPTIDTIKALIDKAGRTFTGLSWTSGPDYVVSALERGDTKRASEPGSGPAEAARRRPRREIR